MPGRSLFTGGAITHLSYLLALQLKINLVEFEFMGGSMAVATVGKFGEHLGWVGFMMTILAFWDRLVL